MTAPVSSQPPTSPPATQLAPPGPSSLPAVPAIFIGHWTGTLTPEISLVGSEPVKLIINGGHLASVIGRAFYPTVNGCTGKLTLENAAKDEVTLQEVYPLNGINTCIPDTMILSPVGSRLSCKVYEGSDVVGAPFFTGTLRRVTSFS